MKKIGINGFGRIGRVVFRLLQTHQDIEVSQINDPMDLDTLIYLLKYDSIHGRFKYEIRKSEGGLIINNKFISISHELSPEKINWKDAEVDIVIESSGNFTTKKDLEKHIDSGAKKVILSCPTNDKKIKTIIIGVNENILNQNDLIISNASCTANCVAPILKIIDNSFGLKSGFMNTVHPFTNNQRIIDSPHPDIRRSRAAATNIIPTVSTAIEAIYHVMPHLKNKIDGFATRVPVANGSFVELCLNLSKNTSIEEINNLFESNSKANFKNIIEYTIDPIVSIDVIDNQNSAVFDSLSTKIINSNFVQIIAWYDNETGYSSRIIDLIGMI